MRVPATCAAFDHVDNQVKYYHGIRFFRWHCLRYGSLANQMEHRRAMDGRHVANSLEYLCPVQTW